MTESIEDFGYGVVEYLTLEEIKEKHGNWLSKKDLKEIKRLIKYDMKNNPFKRLAAYKRALFHYKLALYIGAVIGNRKYHKLFEHLTGRGIGCLCGYFWKDVNMKVYTLTDEFPELICPLKEHEMHTGVTPKVSHMFGFWWTPYDYKSRIEALKKAIILFNQLYSR